MRRLRADHRYINNPALRSFVLILQTPTTIMRVEYAFAVFATLMTLAAATGGARPSGGYFLEALPYYLSGCRSEYFDECLSRTIDGILEKNETYRLNGYLTVKFDKTESGNNVRQVADNGDVVGVRAYGLATRILRFFHALRVRYQPEDDDRPAVLNFEGTVQLKV